MSRSGWAVERSDDGGMTMFAVDLDQYGSGLTFTDKGEAVDYAIVCCNDAIDALRKSRNGFMARRRRLKKREGPK